MITVLSMSKATSDKLGLMSTAGEGAAISVCLTTCSALYLAAYVGMKGEKTTLDIDCSL